MPRLKSLMVLAFIALLGGGFIIALFANRNIPRPAPAAAVWGSPDKAVRVMSYNILHNERGMKRVLEEIQKARPDFVLLQEVERRDLSAMSEALGTLPPIYHGSENLAGGGASWGNAILSRHPLYEAGTIPNPGGGSFGVWATAVVGGKKFKVACVHLSATWNVNPSHLQESSNNRWKELTALTKGWQDLGSPPIVVGGDFNQLAIHNNYALMTRDWRDALKGLGKDDSTFSAGLLKTRIDYFLVSNEWKVIDGGVVESGASDHKPIWIEAGK